MALFRAKFACISVFSNLVFMWVCCKGSEWDRVLIAQECARKQRLAAWSRGWLVAASRQIACQKVNSHVSWSTIGQLAIRLSRDWISRLSQVARPSREPPLFWKTWRFTFSSLLSINTPYTHKWKGASRENFERKTLE